MTLIVVLVGILVIAVSLATLISAKTMRALLHGLLKPRWLPLVSALRIAAGILFVIASPYTRSPKLVWIIGIVAIGAGILILFLGSKRTQLLADWWLNRSDAALRLWSIVAFAFGTVLVWAGY